jgi:hypothetical protein
VAACETTRRMAAMVPRTATGGPRTSPAEDNGSNNNDDGNDAMVGKGCERRRDRAW